MRPPTFDCGLQIGCCRYLKGIVFDLAGAGRRGSGLGWHRVGTSRPQPTTAILAKSVGPTPVHPLELTLSIGTGPQSEIRNPQYR